MERFFDRWKGFYRWIDIGLMDRYLDRWTDIYFDRWTDIYLDRWIDIWIDGQIFGQMDRYLDIYLDRWIDIWIERQIDLGSLIFGSIYL